MKTTLAFVFIAGLSLALSVPVAYSAEPITDITLTSGRTLKHVKFIRWEKERVVVSYAGGADPIAFSLIKSIPLKDLYEMRDTALAQAAMPKVRTITGQVYVTTRGAGAYKFSDATVLVLPANVFDGIDAKAKDELASARALSNSANTPNERAIRYRLLTEAVTSASPLASAKTNADGLYSLAYSGRQPAIIVCATSRLAGRDYEFNFWAVPVDSTDRIDLTSANDF